MKQSDKEELDEVSLDIASAIATVEWFEREKDLVKVTQLLQEAESILDSFIANNE